MTDVNLTDIFIKKLKVKYLRKYIQKQINFLKKVQKIHIQIGGEPNSSDQPKSSVVFDRPKKHGEQIRIPGVSTFFQDAPNIIKRTINIYWRIDIIVNQLKDIAETYDDSGNILYILQLISNLTGTLKIFITLYSAAMKLFSGKWNKKLLDEIREFERKMDAKKQPNSEPSQENWEKLHTLLHELSDIVKKSHPEIKKGVYNEDKKAELIGGGDEVKASTELAALAIQTLKVLDEVKNRSKKVTSEIVPKVFHEYGNPFDKINKSITNTIAAATDVAKAIPGVGAVISGVSVLDKTTQNADLILSMIETNLVLIEEILNDNLEYDEKQQKWIMPILEHGRVWLKLAKNSPEVQKLLQKTANNITDDIIDDTIPRSEEYMNSDWIARGIAKDLQREINKLIEKNVLPDENWEEKHKEIHSITPDTAMPGGFKKTNKHKKKRTNNKTLKKKH